MRPITKIALALTAYAWVGVNYTLNNAKLNRGLETLITAAKQVECGTPTSNSQLRQIARARDDYLRANKAKPVYWQTCRRYGDSDIWETSSFPFFSRTSLCPVKINDHAIRNYLDGLTQ